VTAVDTTVQSTDKITVLSKPGTDYDIAIVQHADGSWFSSTNPVADDTYEVVRTGRPRRGSAWSGIHAELARWDLTGWHKD
jgi:hypothetical protein